MALPGDELIPQGAGQSTKAITTNAPAGIVWQWLVQIGQNRAGYYTYTWLEKDENELILFDDAGEHPLPRAGKLTQAHALLQHAAKHYRQGKMR